MTQKETPQPGPRGNVIATLAATPARQIATLVAISFALRLWTLLQMRSSNPLFAEPVLDDAVYIDAAQRFVDGAPAGAWFLAPLYPTLLGIVGKVLGGGAIGMGPACAVSLACGVATTAVLAYVARRMAGPAAAWISGLLHALAPAFVFHDLIPSQEPVLSLLYAVAILLALRWHTTRAWWSVAAYGATVGLAALGRGTAVVLLPAALPLVLAAAPASVPEALRGRKRALLSAAVAVVGALVVLLPAAARNSSVTGDFTPFTWSFGPNLYAANSPQARDSGTYHSGDLGSTPAEMERNARRIAERRRGRSLRPSEVSAYWTERTVDELDTGPGLASHLGTKALLLFADHPFGTSHSLEAESRFAVWLRVAPGGEYWILAMCVVAWWFARKRTPLADTLALAAVLTAVALLVIYPANRYRLAVLTASTVLIGPAYVWMREEQKSKAVLNVALPILIGVGLLSQVPEFTNRFPHMHADNRANVGRMLLEADRPREAIEVLREADRDEPDSIVVLAPLAAALDAIGDPAGAARAADRHNEIMETLPAGRVRHVLDLAEQGRRDPAALEEAEALGQTLAPTLLNDNLRAHLWANMALVAALRGDTAEAEARMARARDFDPELPHLDDVASRMPR